MTTYIVILIGIVFLAWIVSIAIRPDGITTFEQDVSRTTQTGMRRKQSKS